MHDIASWYTDSNERAIHLVAATEFRIPYMDWAAVPSDGGSLLPPGVGAGKTINVSGPNGVQEINNPLLAYQFKPLNASIFIAPPVSLWSLRYCSLSLALPDLVVVRPVDEHS